MRFRSMGIASAIALASLAWVGAASADPVVVFKERVVIPAAPAPRVEVIPVRPSAEHVWVKGYWHWHPVQRTHVWVPGYWHAAYAPAAPPVARIENPGPAPTARHFWVNGYWKWEGGRWIWIGGHWDEQRGGWQYIHPHWDMVNGRWKYIDGYWKRA